MILIQPKYHWCTIFSPEYDTPNDVHRGLAREIYMNTEYRSRKKMLFVIRRIQEELGRW